MLAPVSPVDQFNVPFVQLIADIVVFWNAQRLSTVFVRTGGVCTPTLIAITFELSEKPQEVKHLAKITFPT